MYESYSDVKHKKNYGTQTIFFKNMIKNNLKGQQYDNDEEEVI